MDCAGLRVTDRKSENRLELLVSALLVFELDNSLVCVRWNMKGVCPMQFRMLSSISGLHTLDGSVVPTPPVRTTVSLSRHCQAALGCEGVPCGFL